MKKSKLIPQSTLYFQVEMNVLLFINFPPFKQGRVEEVLPTHWVLQASAKRWR